MDRENRTFMQYSQRIGIALRTAGIAVFELDVRNSLCTYFENAENLFGTSGASIRQGINAFHGLSPEAFWEACVTYVTHSEDVDKGRDAYDNLILGRNASYHARIRSRGSHWLWCKVDLAPLMMAGELTGIIGVLTDISAMHSETEQIERAAMLDDFTDLYAKTPCLELIRAALRAMPDKNHALLMMDLDNFKDVNDTYGHLVGDQVLLSVAKDLKSLFRSSDIIGRFGGDEFIVFMQNVKSREAILSKLELVILPSGIPYPVTKSVGVAFYPAGGPDLENLLERADKALYRAKETRCAYVIAEE